MADVNDLDSTTTLRSSPPVFSQPSSDFPPSSSQISQSSTQASSVPTSPPSSPPPPTQPLSQATQNMLEQMNHYITTAVGDVDENIHNIFQQTLINMSTYLLNKQTQQRKHLIAKLNHRITENEKQFRNLNKRFHKVLEEQDYRADDEEVERFCRVLDKHEKSRQEFLEDCVRELEEWSWGDGVVVEEMGRVGRGKGGMDEEDIGEEEIGEREVREMQEVDDAAFGEWMSKRS